MENNAPVTQGQLTLQLTAVKDEILSAMRQMLAESRMAFKNDLTGLRNELTEEMRQIETNMLTSFHGYGKGIAHRMHDLEGSDVDIKGRLAALEDRMLNLETRRH